MRRGFRQKVLKHQNTGHVYVVVRERMCVWKGGGGEEWGEEGVRRG